MKDKKFEQVQVGLKLIQRKYLASVLLPNLLQLLRDGNLLITLLALEDERVDALELLPLVGSGGLAGMPATRADIPDAYHQSGREGFISLLVFAFRTFIVIGFLVRLAVLLDGLAEDSFFAGGALRPEHPSRRLALADDAVGEIEAPVHAFRSFQCHAASFLPLRRIAVPPARLRLACW